MTEDITYNLNVGSGVNLPACVTVPDDVKIARYVARMAQSARSPQDLEADARARLAAQIPDSMKVPLCDYVIRNDGSLEETRQQVERIFAELAAVARV